MSVSYHGPVDAALELARRCAAVPAYREEWGSARIESYEDFVRLPLLSKEQLIEGAARQPPYGGRLTVPTEELAYVFASPGPVYSAFTAADMDAACAATAEALRACGFGAEDVVDQVVSYHWVVGGTLTDGALRKLGCAVVPAGPGNTELHLESIRALGATAIVCFPTFLGHLLERAQERGIELPLRKAAIAGEVHESDFRERMLAEHGIVVRERYGVGEVGSVAWQCSEGGGLHLRDDILVEVVDPQTGELVSMADPEPKEFVVTDIPRRGMPMVRYRTGDLVEALDLDPCPCGRRSPRLRRIIGRTGGIPRVKGMFLVPKHVGDVLDRRGTRMRYQLRLDRQTGMDSLTIVLAGAAAEVDDLAGLQEELAATLRMRAEIEFGVLADDAAVVDDRRSIQ